MRLGNVWEMLCTFLVAVMRIVGIGKMEPTSVNYHFTRDCNYSCGFCFHTKKTKDNLNVEVAKRGLKLLRNDGMRKINFAGGEPFLKPEFLGELVKYCKEELHLQSVSIVSNGSKLRESWFQKYGDYLDILAISVDSFNEESNVKIGRGKGDHLTHVQNARDLCQKYGIKFKINTVVCSYNWDEDMNSEIARLAPFRWKVFQVLRLEGENSGKGAIRDVTEFLITDDKFEQFVKRHESQNPVSESNKKMQNSYLILDEKMRFLNCTANGKEPSQSILEVGVQRALSQSGFDKGMFVNRGGIYDWSNELKQACGNLDPSLEW